MTVSISEQALVFISCVAAGCCIGIVFDIFRIFRAVYHWRRVGTAIADMAFWSIALYIVFATVYITGDGKMRWFVFLGCAIGFCLHWYTISPVLLRYAVKMVRTVHMAVCHCARTMFRPVRTMTRFFVRKCEKMKKIVKIAQRKSSENHQKTLAKLRRIGIILKKV